MAKMKTARKIPASAWPKPPDGTRGIIRVEGPRPIVKRIRKVILECFATDELGKPSGIKAKLMEGCPNPGQGVSVSEVLP